MPTGIWTEHTSEAPETKGRKYYFNSLLQKTQWERPAGAHVALMQHVEPEGRLTPQAMRRRACRRHIARVSLVDCLCL